MASPSFQLPNFSTPQQQQQQHQQMVGLVAGNPQHIHLLSQDRSPLSYQAKWIDIHDDSKNLLLAIEERIMEFRDESRRLDQCQRLYDSSALSKNFQLESARISQELGGIAAAVAREHSSLEEMVQLAKQLMRNAEFAVRSFVMLRHHFARPPAPLLTSGAPQGTTAPPTITFNSTSSATPHSTLPLAPVAEFYSGIPSKPSPFLQQTVTRFEAQLSEYRQRIEELERLLFDNGDVQNGNSQSEVLSLLQSLPTVMTNVHDFFIHVAAEVESLHQKIEVTRAAFLADCRRRGDDGNLFLEADRREVAKREVAAKRVHPTLNVVSLLPSAQGTVSAQSAPSTMSAFGSGSFSPAPNLSFSAPGPSTSVFGSSSLFGSQPIASTPFPSVSTQFTPSTPAISPFGSSASPSSFSFFGSSAPTPAAATSSPSLFGGSMGAGAAGTSLFGAGPATSGGVFGSSSGGGLFGSTATGSIFGAQPAAGATPLFGIGSAGGAAPTKPKPRGPRRK